jgi:hypothetical protein
MILGIPDRKTFVRENIRVGNDEPWFPLLSRHGIYLYAPNGGGERFSKLFVETWKRLPLWARRRMLRHWNSYNCSYLGYSPLIQLLSGWSNQRIDRGGGGLRGTKGVVNRLGHHIQFWTKIVAAYPDELVRDLIAHELAHVVQWASGRDLNDDDDDASCVEDHADMLVDNWGFSSTAMDDWDREKGIAQVTDLGDLSIPAQRRAWDRYLKRLKEFGR